MSGLKLFIFDQMYRLYFMYLIWFLICQFYKSNSGDVAELGSKEEPKPQKKSKKMVHQEQSESKLKDLNSLADAKNSFTDFSMAPGASNFTALLNSSFNSDQTYGFQMPSTGHPILQIIATTVFNFRSR